MIIDIMEEMGLYLVLLSETHFFHNSSNHKLVINFLINIGL